jgi:DHA2 family multidrug resistance protein
MGLIVFGTTQFIPQLLQQVLGYTATNAGLALTAGGLATLLVMPLAGFLSTRVDPRLLIGFALVMQGIAMWNMAGLNSQMSFENAAVARMIQSVALPFLFVTITNIAYVGISPEQNNQASALMNVSRNLGGTFGISLVQTMLARQGQVHQSQYVESLNPLNPNYTAAISNTAHQLTANGLPQAQAVGAATAQLYRALGRQAEMLSYIDVFHVLMWVVFAVLPLVLLLKKPDKLQGGGGAAA